MSFLGVTKEIENLEIENKISLIIFIPYLEQFKYLDIFTTSIGNGIFIN